MYPTDLTYEIREAAFKSCDQEGRHVFVSRMYPPADDCVCVCGSRTWGENVRLIYEQQAAGQAQPFSTEGSQP